MKWLTRRAQLPSIDLVFKTATLNCDEINTNVKIFLFPLLTFTGLSKGKDKHTEEAPWRDPQTKASHICHVICSLSETAVTDSVREMQGLATDHDDTEPEIPIFFSPVFIPCKRK